MDDIPISATLDTIRDRIAELINEGRGDAALPLLAAARVLGMRPSEIRFLRGRLHIQAGRLREATTDIDAAMSSAPLDTALLKCRSALRRRTGDREGAVKDAAEAVIADPRDPEAKLFLGQALVEFGRGAEGLSCLANALQIAPKDSRYWEALAAALDTEGDPDAALSVLEDGIRIFPGHLSVRNRAVLLCIQRGNFAAAAQIAEQARAAGIVDASTLGMAGHVLVSLGEFERAAASFREALKLCPEDRNLSRLVATTENRTDTSNTPAIFLRAIFDGYAEQFEVHVLSLRYSVPVSIRKLLLAHPKIAAAESIGPALDLGCGTGLIALAVEDLGIGPFTGIDLAPKMLAQAKAKGLYTELIENDIISELSVSTRRWPLILAADVICYFGALDEILSQTLRSLADGGWFVFSAERPAFDLRVEGVEDRAWVRIRHGRYAHTEHYIFESLSAAGFQILHMEQLPIRQEAGINVPGLLFAAQRVDRDVRPRVQ